MRQGEQVATFGALALRVLAGPPRLGRVRVVAVDGPAGSGKTTFAGRLALALRDTGASVGEVHVDDLLEGWADLDTYWPRLEAQILEPLRRGEPARYQRYDWNEGHFLPNLVPLPVPDVLVFEGVGSAREALGSRRSLGVYVHAGREVRLARGIERDGESLRSHWLRWMAAEDRHFALEHTATRADVRVEGAPEVIHDPVTEYVESPPR